MDSELDFCIERGFPDEAKAFYQKALDKLRSEGNKRTKKPNLLKNSKPLNNPQ